MMWDLEGIKDFGVFLAAAAMLAVVPGQDTFYVMGRSLAQGSRAGIASLVGILCGAIVHLLAGGCGLSALLAASPSAFLVVRWMGGAYLAYMGIRMFLARDQKPETAAVSDGRNLFPLVRQGMLTNLLNPKVALFILAFIPQFIRPESDRKTVDFLFLGGCFFLIGSLWLLCIVVFAAEIGKRFKEHPKFSMKLNRAAGGLFLILGVKLWIAG